MYKKQKPSKGTLKANKAYTGETIEAKVRRMVNNKEPIKDTGPLNYTEREDGVIKDYDIRTDRFEEALDAMDKASKSQTAKRGQSLGEKAYENMNKEQKEQFHKKYPHSEKTKASQRPKDDGKIGGPEPVQA